MEWTNEDMAYVMNEVMVGLGLEGYIAHGGDIGSFLSRICAVRYDACRGTFSSVLVADTLLTRDISYQPYVNMALLLSKTGKTVTADLPSQFLPHGLRTRRRRCILSLRLGT